MVIPGVLSDEDLRRVRDRFGVGEAQVRRDHIISHALAALSDVSERFVFFGGTALARTALPDLRLSEDIDLIAVGGRASVARAVESSLARRLGRTVGRPSFVPPLVETSGASPTIMHVRDSRVQLQLLSSVGYPAWPTTIVDVEQRYSDVSPTRLRVLTPAAFAAAKLAAWSERGTARDLYDMWALAERGHISPEASKLFARFGPATRATAVPFARIPSEIQWQYALGHQCRLSVSAARAAEVVETAWRDACADPDSLDVGGAP